MNKYLAVHFLISLLAMAGCTDSPPTPKAISVNSHLCQSTKEYTTFAVGSYVIKIFEPNDLKNPDIWQGPVCILSEQNKVSCGFDLSLVKSVKPTADMKEIEVVIFSGSNSRTARITLSNCQLKQ